MYTEMTRIPMHIRPNAGRRQVSRARPAAARTGTTIVARARSSDQSVGRAATKSPGPLAARKSNWPRNWVPVTSQMTPSSVVGWLYGSGGLRRAASGM